MRLYSLIGLYIGNSGLEVRSACAITLLGRADPMEVNDYKTLVGRLLSEHDYRVDKVAKVLINKYDFESVPHISVSFQQTGISTSHLNDKLDAVKSGFKALRND